MIKKYHKAFILLMATSLSLVACKKEEPMPIPEPEPVEEVDMEEFRVEGDRVMDEPVLETVEREKRHVIQYETIDRPIIMNTLRYIHYFDTDHAESYNGVRLVTDKSIDRIKDEKIAEYTEHLGEPLAEETTKVYDIREVYPYTEDDFKSYYQTVNSILRDEVMGRTQLYNSINKGIEERDFDYIKKSGVIRNFKGIIDPNNGLYEQVRPYIEEMDKLVALKRKELEMGDFKYKTFEADIEKVNDYKVPKEATVQEIIKEEPSMELYEEHLKESEDGDKEDNNDSEDGDKESKEDNK